MGVFDALGDVVSGGFGIAGGLLSGAQNRQAQRASADLQRDFAKHGIQWKVEDAERAGLHPLAALGMMPTSATPMVLGDTAGPALAEAGQHIGRAVSAGVSEDTRKRAELENRLLESQIGETDMRKLAIVSEIQRNNQAKNSSIGVQPETQLGIEGQAPIVGPMPPGVIDLEPSKVTSASQYRRSKEAGTRPGEEERIIGQMPMSMPQLGGESSEEIFSEMSPLSWAGLLARNSRLYGKGWLEDFLKMRYGGIEPKTYYPTIQEQQSLGRYEYLSDDPVSVAIRRAVEKGKGLKRRYRNFDWKKWSEEHPSGRR